MTPETRACCVFYLFVDCHVGQWPSTVTVVVWWGVMWVAVWWGVMWCGEVCGVWCGEVCGVWWGVVCGVWCGGVCGVWWGVVCVVWCGAVCGVWCGAVCGVWCGAVCVVWCGMVWYGWMLSSSLLSHPLRIPAVYIALQWVTFAPPCAQAISTSVDWVTVAQSGGPRHTVWSMWCVASVIFKCTVWCA